ncbi:MAG TPA: WecB/TagA/CpsF family glycosyltransferase [bacterium]|nr:WecB/TagA/CpsF family glycosyltransferase [bacterium]
MAIKILGVKLNQETPAEIKKIITAWLNQEASRLIVTVNPEFVVAAQHNPEFRAVLNRADLATCDGIGLVWAAKLLTGQTIFRLTGVDLTSYLLTLSSVQPRPRLYLLGGRKNSAELIARQYPMNVVGANSEVTLVSAQRLENNEAVIDAINHSGATVLLVAFGQQKQELWLANNLKKMPQLKIAMGVGGTFDYLSGQVKRAPSWLRAAGLEWLFRLLIQPRRIKRIFRAVIVFSWLVIKEYWQSNKKTQK